MNVVLLLSREEIFCSSQMPKVRTPFGQSEARICMTSQTLINFLHVVMTVLISLYVCRRCSTTKHLKSKGKVFYLHRYVNNRKITTHDMPCIRYSNTMLQLPPYLVPQISIHTFLAEKQTRKLNELSRCQLFWSL